MTSQRPIKIRGAREHNLKNISLDIPRNQLVVITGLSGSGKSSLAFDTIYAEGQRRYLESLSAYARQFLEQMKKPAVTSIDGLSPSISIEQKNISRNPRSTVGTVTEIYDFLRLLFARIGEAHCYRCGKRVQTQTPGQIAEQILQYPSGTKFSVLAPIVRGKKGEYQKELSELRRQGFVRARIDGEQVDLSAAIRLKKNLKHDISIYVDRLVIKPGIEPRLNEAIEMAGKLADGMTEVEVSDVPGSRLFSTRFACVECGISYTELEPRNFSFNSPHGACSACDGLGVEYRFDEALIVARPDLSIVDGAIAPWQDKPSSWVKRIAESLGKHDDFDPRKPFQELSEIARRTLLHGSEEDVEFSVAKGGKTHQFTQKFEGIIPQLERLLDEAESDEEKAEIELFLSPVPCKTCHGKRLNREALSVLIEGKSISDFCDLDVKSGLAYLERFKPKKNQKAIAEPVLKEIVARMSFLKDVGLGYLTLSRSASTLSGGEAQRIRLATQIGSHLVGVLYVLDEPSIGLHQRDNDRLIATLERLRDLGNTVLVVEHDEDTIRRADTVIDIGPGAGIHGGEILFCGAPGTLARNTKSLTGQYLSGKKTIPVPATRRPLPAEKEIRIVGANRHNLKAIDVSFPLGRFICVSGVSGSGKSSLVIDTLLEAARDGLAGKFPATPPFERIEGLEHLDKVIHVDQSPIGRTPRSNPATYTGTFTEIRALYASLPSAKMRGYTQSQFSFNIPGGRCEACRGDGNIKITMQFLPDVYVPCEVCQGKRYNRDTLQVLYHGKSISDVLNMSIEQATEFFSRIPRLREKFKTLLDVGLGYVQVGQSAVTLSGGEAQRIKLARELTKRATGRTLYILDEPTTGLHFDDVRKLMEILHHLTDQGNTVVVIEHHLDVIKQADYVIDLGPEGGDEGGRIVFEGTVEELRKKKGSHTGLYLNKALGREPEASGKSGEPTTACPRA